MRASTLACKSAGAQLRPQWASGQAALRHVQDVFAAARKHNRRGAARAWLHRASGCISWPGCRWSRARAGCWGQRMRGVGCCWLSSSGAIRARWRAAPWRRRWRSPGDSPRVGRHIASMRGLLCCQVARFGGPPGRPHARRGARGAASLHSLTGRHAIADAGSVDAGL